MVQGETVCNFGKDDGAAQRCFQQCLDVIDEAVRKLPDQGYESDSRQDFKLSLKLTESFRLALDQYKDHTAHFDEHAEQLIKQLTNIVLSSSGEPINIRYHTAFKLLYNLVKIRGFKSLSGKFPQDNELLCKILQLLEREHCDDRANWQTRYVLTLWLTILIPVPFEIKHDSENDTENLRKRIETLLVRNLQSHDACRFITSQALRRLVSASSNKSDDPTKSTKASPSRRLGSSVGFVNYGAQFSKAIFEGRFKYLHGLHKQTYMGLNSLCSQSRDRPAAFFRSSLPATPIATPIGLQPRYQFTEQTLHRKLAKCELIDNIDTNPSCSTALVPTAAKGSSSKKGSTRKVNDSSASAQD